MAEKTVSLIFDVRRADADYKPFPSFIEWQRNTQLETIRWDRYTNRLNQLKELINGNVSRVREAIEVATAIDTGALEGLYETDRGFTYTIAFESAVWQLAVEQSKGEKVRALIEAQLNAFEYVLDFATKSVPVSSAWIRELHKEICREQDTYKAYTELGLQDLPLPKGEYKILPNHVRKQDGSIHSHAPVDLTVNEMFRLCDELNTDEFQNSYPVLQASYAHYAFVLIHPFADGNGRVSRALASIYTYRSHSIPLLIFSDSRSNYLSALEEADNGNYQAFVDFILEVGLSSIQLFSESLNNGVEPKIEDSIEKINDLFMTKGGYTHKEVDEAGFKLTEMFAQELAQQLANSKLPENIKSSVSKSKALNSVSSSAYRQPVIDGIGLIRFILSTPQPVSADVLHQYNLEVPKDCGQSDDIVLRDKQIDYIFEARASELIPNATATLQMRIKLAVKSIISNALAELFKMANKKLRG